MPRTSLTMLAGLSLAVTACGAAPPPATPATEAYISCDDATPIPVGYSALPAFTPSYPCELEKAANSESCMLTQPTPQRSYPCGQSEMVEETLLGEGDQSVLIQRYTLFSAGCWHGTNRERRSLKACDPSNGESTVLAEGVIGEAHPSPDGAWYAFMATGPDISALTPHVYKVRADGSEMVQLDTQRFPQSQVVGGAILGWSSDGAWVEITLWDASNNIWHEYRLLTDGSGGFEVLP